LEYFLFKRSKRASIDTEASSDLAFSFWDEVVFALEVGKTTTDLRYQNQQYSSGSDNYFTLTIQWLVTPSEWIQNHERILAVVWMLQTEWE
jgi:hypothetical protein